MYKNRLKKLEKILNTKKCPQIIVWLDVKTNLYHYNGKIYTTEDDLRKDNTIDIDEEILTFSWMNYNGIHKTP